MHFRNLFVFALLFLSLLSKGQSPESIALKICQNFEARSSFTLVDKATNSIQEGILVVYLPSEEESLYTVETVVTISKLGGNYLNLAANEGFIKVWRDDELLFEGNTSTKNAPVALGEGYFGHEFKEALPPFQGDYKIRIEYDPATTKRAIFLWVTDEAKRVQSVDYRSTWDYTESSHYRFASKKSKDAPAQDWSYPKEIVAPQFENEKPINDWTYENGFMLEAMRLASEQFNELEYKAFVKKHLNFFAQNTSVQENAVISLVRPPFFQYFRYQDLSDYGLQTTAFLNFSNEDAFKPLTSKGLNKVLYKSIRTAEGLFARHAPDSLTVWAEDLYFGTALLCKSYEANRSRKYLEEAIKQVILFNRKLKDRYSGLYWHGYYTETKEHSSSKYALANGFMMMAKVELLKVLPESHSEREAILKIFRDHAASVRQLQSLDGRWNQILNEDSTYLETSASALFVSAFAEGILNNWLYNKEEFRKSAISGWLSIVNTVDNQGMIDGVSPKLSVLGADQEYDAVQPTSDNLVGSASVLMAAIAIDKLNKQ